MKKVFIDGSAGTTGLRIVERLSTRTDLSVTVLPDEVRKDAAARRQALNEADIAFLCLPDDAARESAAMVENPHTVVLDTSTAHRTAAGWTYGFPELSKEQAEAVTCAKRIAVPGCHASGFIALIAPLVKAGLVDKGALLTCTSLTGYSGGGKRMIADYEAQGRDVLLSAPRQYGLSQTHKHLPEMKAVTGMDHAPAFLPIVGDFYSGMEVTVPLFVSQLQGSVEDIKRVYKDLYRTPCVFYTEEGYMPDAVKGVLPAEGGFLSAGALSGLDCMQITVSGNRERILLVARYDNLGKGASGAAIACMNLALGLPIETGLALLQ